MRGKESRGHQGGTYVVAFALCCSLGHTAISLIDAGKLLRTQDARKHPLAQAPPPCPTRARNTPVTNTPPPGWQPSVQEKRMFNPDHHPVELDITLSKELKAKVPKPT